MHIKKILTPIKAFFLIGLLFSTTVLIPSENTFAAGLDDEPNPGVFLNARWIDAVATCTRAIGDDGSPALKQRLNQTEYNTMSIFVDGRGNTGRVVTGHDLAVSTGEIACAEIVPFSIAPVDEVFGSTDALIDLFYDKIGSAYTLKSETDRKAASDKLLATPYVSANDKGELRRARLAFAFSQCFKESTGDSSDFSDRSKKYKYRDGKSGGSNIAVGLGAIGSTNEKLTCSTLANLARSTEEDLVKFMEDNNVSTGVLRNSPQDLYENLGANYAGEVIVSSVRPFVVEALTINPDKVSFCLSAAGLPNVIGVTSITEFLLTGDYESNLVYAVAGGGVPATEQQATALEGCLLDERVLGNELRDRLSSLRDNLAIVEEERANNTGNTGDVQISTSDECLKNDDFLGWVVCPMLDAIDSVLDYMKDRIEEMLQFSMSDQASEEGIKEAWNIFRSLSTTLLIIGFLLALLVKAIRGE